ncbi:MAG: heme-binding protein [Thermoplasmata archaeon]|nr:MAG: heme-binding protein [Thermoplasmata archaeon]
MVKKAKYTVVRDLGRVEVRRYEPMVIAKVDSYRGSGFNLLFRYITGENRDRSKVAMTAPVISERSDQGERIAMTAPVYTQEDSMAFVMPEGYTLETTPLPGDDRVTIEEVPGRYVAALRFSGRWTDSAFEKRSAQLVGTLEREGIGTVGTVFSMLYNPPFTPPFLRRNEVAIEIIVE